MSKKVKLFARIIAASIALYVFVNLLGVACFFFLIASCDDRAEKSDIFVFVGKHEAELLKAIETDDFTAFENKGFIKDIGSDDQSVDFSCGGAGFGSATSYVGFYYTPKLDPTSVWCAPASPYLLRSCGRGFEWRQEDGDNRYYTEHICGNFFYYEASF